MAATNLFENLLTLAILFTFGMVIYLKVTKQTLIEFIKGTKEALAEAPVVVADKVQGGFESIR